MKHLYILIMFLTYTALQFASAQELTTVDWISKESKQKIREAEEFAKKAKTIIIDADAVYAKADELRQKAVNSGALAQKSMFEKADKTEAQAIDKLLSAAMFYEKANKSLFDVYEKNFTAMLKKFKGQKSDVEEVKRLQAIARMHFSDADKLKMDASAKNDKKYLLLMRAYNLQVLAINEYEKAYSMMLNKEDKELDKKIDELQSLLKARTLIFYSDSIYSTINPFEKITGQKYKDNPLSKLLSFFPLNKEALSKKNTSIDKVKNLVASSLEKRNKQMEKAEDIFTSTKKKTAGIPLMKKYKGDGNGKFSAKNSKSQSNKTVPWYKIKNTTDINRQIEPDTTLTAQTDSAKTKKVIRIPKHNVIFYVQVASAQYAMSDAEIRKHYAGELFVEHIYHQGWHRYVIGYFRNYDDALSFKNQFGIGGLFIYAEKDGKILPVKDAIIESGNIY